MSPEQPDSSARSPINLALTALTVDWNEQVGHTGGELHYSAIVSRFHHNLVMSMGWDNRDGLAFQH